ncbi:MAG: GMC oxidoreductase [Bryobacteraceae bacterium]|jgi:choline dehydrogenase-like flavoprotein
MSANFSEAFRGTLARPSGISDSFACTLNFQLADLTSPSVTDGLPVSIVGGSVDWAYLGASANITSGAIDLFRPPQKPGDPVTTAYTFAFSANGANFTFNGEKRFAGPIAANDLSTVYASVTGTAGVLASGVLTAELDQLLREYEGILADGQHVVADLSAARQKLHDFLNSRLAAIFPQLPPMLATGRTMPQGLWKTLALLAEVLLPTPFPANGPAIADVVDGIEGFLAVASGKQVQTIRNLLQVISLFIPVLDLAVNETRQLVANVLADESDSPIRQALSGVHQIVAFAYYANQKTDSLLEYARPVHKPGHRTNLPVSATIPNRVFDVVIAGTGPAGSLLADRLSAAGKSVLLLEAGQYIAEQSITTDELNSIARLYKMSGLQTSIAPSSITVLQGSCVGGGGVINNGIFFPLASATLDTWRSAGFPFDADAMARAYAAVASDLNIGDILLKARGINPAAQFLSSLGPLQTPPMGPVPPGFYRMMVNLETLPPNGDATGCRSTGLCNLGCGSERKVNSFQYYLKNALTTGRDVVLVPQASVTSAVMGLGAARHTVTALNVQMADGSTAMARGKSFVLSCGPVGSSVVLLRSGDLLSAAGGKLPVGQRFCGNVASPVFAAAPFPVNQQTYVQMCQVFVPAAGDDGFLIETWFSPPGALALAMPGYLDAHQQRMNQFQRLVSASPVIGTQPLGTITLQFDDPVIDLPLAPVDLDRFRRGMNRTVTALIGGKASPVIVRLGNGRVIATMDDVSRLDAEMAALTPQELYLLPLSTAHPQGGNAMSGDPAIGVVGADFRVRGIDNLRVCDGSIFPVVAGVNPQWTIYALAHLCAADFD